MKTVCETYFLPKSSLIGSQTNSRFLTHFVAQRVEPALLRNITVPGCLVLRSGDFRAAVTAPPAHQR